MTTVAQFFPFDESHLAGGQARILFAPITNTPVPASPADIFEQETPYTPKSGGTGLTAYAWEDFGATAAPLEYGRNLTVNEWKIQQQTSAVLEDPQEVVRTLKIPMAEFRPDLIQLLENAPEVAAIAAAAGSSAFNAVGFGSVSDLTQYRVAYAIVRPKEAGIVVESGGNERGRLLVQAAYRCSVSAENVSITFGLSEMASADLTLKLYPEPGQPQGQEYGSWFDEVAGTIGS